MLKALIKFFVGGGEEESPSCCSCGCTAEKEQPARTTGNTACGIGELEKFVRFVVGSLVDAPDEVKLETVENGDGYTIRISCRKEDIGKIVGKRGKTIMAIRSLVSGAAGRMRKHVSVEVLD